MTPGKTPESSRCGPDRIAKRSAATLSAVPRSSTQQPCNVSSPPDTPPETQIRRAGRGSVRPLTVRIRRALYLLPAVWPALIDVTCAAWAVRQGGDPRRFLQRWSGARARQPISPEQLNRALIVTQRVTWWLHPRRRRDGICLPRAYATYRALRRAGHPAVFVSGVARVNGSLLSHAWVEDHQGALAAYAEPHNRQLYRPLLEYPPAP